MKDWLHGRRIRLPHVSLNSKPAQVAGTAARGLSAGGGAAGPAGGLGETILFVTLDGNSWGRVSRGLIAASYEVTGARGLAAALERVAAAPPDLVIVGGPADTAVYKALRAVTTAPILALLVEGGEAGMLSVLAAGADDSQPATLGMREVICRVRGLLRRGA